MGLNSHDDSMVVTSRASYEARICEAFAVATVPPYRQVSLPEWVPIVSHCHLNVDRWVESNPGHSTVRGWVLYMSCLHESGIMGTMLTAHSVVREPAGTLYDITPLGDESVRASLRFVPHIGTEEEFWQWEKSNRCICCPIEWEQEMPDGVEWNSNFEDASRAESDELYDGLMFD